MTRAGVSLLRAPNPQPCTVCGPDCSPHLESLELVYRIEWIRIRRPVCEARALAAALDAMAGNAVPDHELDAAIARQIERVEAELARVEIENESLAREVGEAHAALGELDERISALCTKH